MPRTKTGTTSTTNTISVAEMQEWYEKNKATIENYAEVSDAIKLLRDVTKNANVNIQTFDKDVVITYLQNLGSNEANLRNLSTYLYYRSMIYYRLINFYASMYELDCRMVIPSKEVYDPTKNTNQDKKMLKNYYETVNLLDTMNLSRHMQPSLINAVKDDVSFNLYWLDDTGMIIIPIPADYGRVDGITPEGCFTWSMDMTYFRSRQELLEYWSDPIEEMYHEYERTRVKWIHVPEEHGLCLKYNSHDYNLMVPPLVGLFLSLISLEDLGDLTAIQNEQDIYKLLIYKLKGRAGAKNSDEFEVDPKSGAKYFNKFVAEALPNYTSAAMMPGSEDLQVVSFSDDATTDTNKMAKALTNILDFSGGGELLIGTKITSAQALKLAMILNQNFAMHSLLPQIEGWVEMVMRLNLKNPAKVKLARVSSFTKEDYKKELLEAAQNGLPTALSYMNALTGISERDTLALNALQTAMGLPEMFKPLQSSYTQPGTSGEVGQGRPEKDPADLTDSGDRSRNQ